MELTIHAAAGEAVPLLFAEPMLSVSHNLEQTRLASELCFPVILLVPSFHLLYCWFVVIKASLFQLFNFLSLSLSPGYLRQFFPQHAPPVRHGGFPFALSVYLTATSLGHHCFPSALAMLIA